MDGYGQSGVGVKAHNTGVIADMFVFQPDQMIGQCNLCLARNTPIICLEGSHPRASPKFVMMVCIRCGGEMAQRLVQLLTQLVVEREEVDK